MQGWEGGSSRGDTQTEGALCTQAEAFQQSTLLKGAGETQDSKAATRSFPKATRATRYKLLIKVYYGN